MKRGRPRAICACGDYREEHASKVGRCLACADLPQPAGGCRRYELVAFEHADGTVVAPRDRAPWPDEVWHQ